MSGEDRWFPGGFSSAQLSIFFYHPKKVLMLLAASQRKPKSADNIDFVGVRVF
jgi:hypothetical protein